MKKATLVLCLLVAVVGGFAYWHFNQQGKSGNPTPAAVPSPTPKPEPKEPQKRNEQVLKLVASTERREQRKPAMELGDQAIAGTLELSDADREAIKGYVDRTLELALSKEGNDRYEARAQFARLWYLANPGLIPHISGNDVKKAEMAAKALILARNEDAVRALIAYTKTVKDPDSREMCIFVLGKMTEQRTTLIENRQCMNPEKSKELFDRVVVPALKELEGE